MKRIVAVAMLLLSAFTLVFPLAYSFPLILGLAVVVGIVMSPMPSATTQAVIDWFPTRIRALVMGVKQMGVPMVVCPPKRRPVLVLD